MAHDKLIIFIIITIIQGSAYRIGQIEIKLFSDDRLISILAPE